MSVEQIFEELKSVLEPTFEVINSREEDTKYLFDCNYVESNTTVVLGYDTNSNKYGFYLLNGGYKTCNFDSIEDFVEFVTIYMYVYTVFQVKAEKLSHMYCDKFDLTAEYMDFEGEDINSIVVRYKVLSNGNTLIVQSKNNIFAVAEVTYVSEDKFNVKNRQDYLESDGVFVEILTYENIFENINTAFAQYNVIVDKSKKIISLDVPNVDGTVVLRVHQGITPYYTLVSVGADSMEFVLNPTDYVNTGEVIGLIRSRVSTISEPTDDAIFEEIIEDTATEEPSNAEEFETTTDMEDSFEEVETVEDDEVIEDETVFEDSEDLEDVDFENETTALDDDEYVEDTDESKEYLATTEITDVVSEPDAIEEVAETKETEKNEDTVETDTEIATEVIETDAGEEIAEHEETELSEDFTDNVDDTEVVEENEDVKHSEEVENASDETEELSDVAPTTSIAHITQEGAMQINKVYKIEEDNSLLFDCEDNLYLVEGEYLKDKKIPFDRFKYTDSYVQSAFGELLSTEKEQGRFVVKVTDDEMITTLLQGLFA